LRHPRSFFQDTSADYQDVLHGRMEEAELRKFWRRYAETMHASKFVLCPRGLGVSSVRLFDTMRIGRVPVILSDDWVEPNGPSWEKFSIRIPEAKFKCIPDLLEKRETQAVEMGLMARKQWEDWFSIDVCFHRVVQWCLQIKNERRVPEKVAGLVPYLQYLRPFHFRHRLRTMWRRN
jgi:exostosin family protein